MQLSSSRRIICELSATAGLPKGCSSQPHRVAAQPVFTARTWFAGSEPGEHAMRLGTKGQGCEPRFLAVLSFLTALILLSFCPIALADVPRKKMVVVLYPDSNDGRPGSILTDRGIRSTFASGSAENIEIQSEYLDVSRF